MDEKNKTVNATIVRLGDLTLPASVVCYTRQLTATVMMDYAERVRTNQSRVHFEPGDRVSALFDGLLYVIERQKHTPTQHECCFMLTTRAQITLSRDLFNPQLKRGQ